MVTGSCENRGAVSAIIEANAALEVSLSGQNASGWLLLTVSDVRLAITGDYW